MFENFNLSQYWNSEIVVLIPTLVVETLKLPSPDNPRVIYNSITLAARWLTFSAEFSFFWEDIK